MEITIVMCCYNKSKFVGQTIDSVVNQSAANWRLLIIDDFSKDGSDKIIKEKLNDSRITFIQNDKNMGANFCRNKGIELSETEYLMFLDADDLLMPDCIARRTNSAKIEPTANLLVFTMGVFKSKVGDSPYLWLPKVKQPLIDLLSHKLSWSILQPLWKKDLIVSLNGFDERFKRLQDVDLNTRALLSEKTKVVCFNGKPDCFYRIDPSRINYEMSEFMERWIDASNLYFEKFLKLVPKKQAKYLVLTLFQTYLQLIHYKKQGQISIDNYLKLEKKILENKMNIDFMGRRLLLFKLAKAVNSQLRVPGFNFLIKRALTL